MENSLKIKDRDGNLYFIKIDEVIYIKISKKSHGIREILIVFEHNDKLIINVKDDEMIEKIVEQLDL